MSEVKTAPANIDELKRVGIIAQKQKDTYLIRLRTVGGDMTAGDLETVARVSRTYASGGVHLTTRQAIEIHDIPVENLQAAREELEENGIVLGVCGPRGRGIVACPGNATCTSGLVETKELASELDAVYLRIQAPHKFKIGISGCPNNCSKPVENDIGIMGGVLPAWKQEACVACKLCVSICPAEAITQQGERFVLDEQKCILCGLCIRNCSSAAWVAKKTGYTLYLGGTMGKRPRLGTKARILIESREDLLHSIRRAFDFYVAHGRKKERFGHTLDRIGTDSAFACIFSDQTGGAVHQPQPNAAPAARKNILDLRGVCCPLNFVKARLAMEKVRSGEIIEFYLDDGEPIVNVTRSLKDEGHQVLLVTPEEHFFKVMVEKKQGAGNGRDL
ncbi:MAG TPA: sulfurtransferase TusA family protein [Nitrospirota bacterium]|nr:sulfurtransferase TusA family protein [Nitrospirota bacterium]